MEEKIRSRFNDAILAEARQRYGIASNKVEELGGFESFMYGFAKDGARYVLRLGHSLRRSPDLIRGEVDWINHLARGGTGVAKAVNSDAGNLVELIDDGQGECFLATAFAWAKGGPIWQNGGWTEPFIWPLFWQGYCEENELDPVWLKEILPFMKLREIDLYGVIRRDIPDLSGDGWAAGFMRGRQEKILAERPYIDFNFEEIVQNDHSR